MRKNNIKQLLRQSSGQSTDFAQSDDLADLDPLFQQYEKNLFVSHKVPKMKVVDK